MIFTGFALVIIKSPTKVNEQSYKSQVRAIVEYSATLWDPHKDENKNKVEMVHRLAVRSVCNDHSRCSSVTKLLTKCHVLKSDKI